MMSVVNTNKLLTPTKFSMRIENLAKDSESTFLDALLDYCEKNSVEPEQVKPLITKSLKEKLEVNARELNFLPKVATLPI